VTQPIVAAPFDGTPTDWDGFGQSVPGWTGFHRWAWREVFESALKHEALYLAATSGSRIEGILPLVEVDSVVFGRYLVSLPFVNYGGPLGTPAGVTSLIDAATAEARRRRVRLLELRSRIELATRLSVSHRKITVVLPLAATGDALMKSFPAKLRSQIRRPFKEGLEVRFGNEQVGPFYSVFARHMRDLGTPVLPRRFFEAIATHLGDDAWFGCAYLGNRPVAGGVAIRWNAELEITWASALLEYNRISANMGLYWGFMERAMAEGIDTFNFGRCTPESGTHRYKRQWGGRDEMLWWYQESKSGVDATPSPDRGVYSLGPRVWKRLPLQVANLIGPRISRSIP
jgi:FemAB-related protein (PEP-CTERM system-associated)